MARDYYEILELCPSATLDEIKKAHRKLAFEHHPDRNLSPSAETRVKDILEAYHVLSDVKLRAAYDAKRVPTISACNSTLSGTIGWRVSVQALETPSVLRINDLRLKTAIARYKETQALGEKTNRKGTRLNIFM